MKNNELACNSWGTLMYVLKVEALSAGETSQPNGSLALLAAMLQTT